MERRKEKLGGAEHGHLEPMAASVLVIVSPRWCLIKQALAAPATSKDCYM